MSQPRIFITGTSGYVGGDVLHTILNAHPEWEDSITCLLRNPNHEALFKAKYPKLKLLFAELDDTARIEEEVANHEVIIHFALSADHVPSATAIINGLRKRGGGVYIHTSGTDVLLNPDEAGKADSNEVHVFNDWDGITELGSLPDKAAHRDVDKLVLAAGSDTLKTAIICPSTVFGAARGPISQTSDQMYKLTRLILERGKGLQLADGKSFWNYVHIYDLSRLYLHLVEGVISGESKATWNSEGYYLVESGTYFWGDVCRGIIQEAYTLGLLSSDEVEIIGVEDRTIMAPAGRPVGNYSVKAKALRARKLLGWVPVEGTLEDEIPGIVRAEALDLGLLLN